MNPTQNLRVVSRGIAVIVAVVIIAALYLGRDVLIPVVLAGLFCFLLAPIVNRLQRWRIPRIPAVLITTALSFAAVGILGYIVAGQLIDLAYKLPSYKENISAKILSFHVPSEGPWSQLTATLRELRAEATGATKDGAADSAAGAITGPKDQRATPVEIVNPPNTVTDIFNKAVSPILGPLGTGAVVIVFVVFMLLKKEDLRNRLIHLAGRNRLSLTTHALHDAGERVSRYLLMQLIVNVTYGIPIALGLYFIGVPNAILWGVLAAVLRFIPYIGAWIAAVFPIVLSLAASDSWTMPLLTVALFVVIELVSNNVVEPWLYGTSTGLSPVAIMIAAIFWTWLWGSVGLLLSTPLTVCLAVLGKHVPALAFFEVLLGDEPTLPASDRYYQRLLARDASEAAQIADEFLKKNPLPALFAEVFAIAVIAAEADVEAGVLDAEGRQFVYESVRQETRDRLGPEFQTNDAATAEVLILPAEDEGDEILGELLRATLAPTIRAHCAAWDALANEKADLVTEAAPLVCISETSRHDHAHTDYLCKRIRARSPQATIIAGLWGMELPDAKLAPLAQKLTADRVVRDLVTARETLRGSVVG